MRKRIQHAGAAALVQLSAVSALVCACSGDVVDLGEVANDLSSAPTRCQDSAIVEGSVVVENQAQLDELRGCEEITGNFYVRPFDGHPDFHALSDLVRVRGELELGRSTALDPFELAPEEVDAFSELLAHEQANLDAGWITSLEGFDKLESVSSLTLNGIAVPNLQGLSSLRALTEGGVIALGSCTGLIDLTGLENVVGLVDFYDNCFTLESLRGLNFPSRVGTIILSSPLFEVAPLHDLGDFAPSAAKEIRIEFTSIENLDALAGLTDVGRLDLFGNAALVDADALDALNTVNTLRIASSPLLERLPEFNGMFEIGRLTLFGNSALTNFPSFPNVGLIGDEWGNLAPEDALRVAPSIIDITLNTSLTELVFPSTWLAASYVTIGGNDSLRHIDLNNIHAADGLYISTNPALESVDLGELQTVDDLRVIDNPLLPLEPFDAIRTFTRLIQPGPLQYDEVTGELIPPPEQPSDEPSEPSDPEPPSEPADPDAP